MRHMKKLVSLLLALILLLGLATPAMADQEGTLTGGSITIENAVSEQTYNAYQILYLESYSTNAEGEATGAYAYKVNSAWNDFFKKAENPGEEDGPGLEYVNIDLQGYVTWKRKDSDGNPTGMAEFAKAALAYAQELVGEEGSKHARISPDETKIAEETTVEFTNLNLGYYLVDTTLGTLCSLDTTNPTAKMYEKNEAPTVDKQVQEDSTEDWGDSNTAQIGDTVNFKTTISAKPGAQNYVLHDKMSDGLTLDVDTIKVQAGPDEDNLSDLSSTSDYTVKTSELIDDCDFEITFNRAYLDTITSGIKIVVTYRAILNDEAVIATASDADEINVNKNETKLEYGDDSDTVWDETKTYTFFFDIVKTKSDSSSNPGSYELLDGAEFALYDAQTGGNQIDLVLDEGKYRVATVAEKGGEGFSSATIVATNGRATVIGLDANIYWLEETKQPDGYNKLADRVEVAIVDDSIFTSLTSTSTHWTEANDAGINDGGIHIINQTGAELPSTGGIGTTIFYVAGGILAVGAAVLLIVKRRMDAMK